MAKQNCEGLLTVDGVNGEGGEISIKNKFKLRVWGGGVKFQLRTSFLI